MTIEVYDNDKTYGGYNEYQICITTLATWYRYNQY